MLIGIWARYATADALGPDTNEFLLPWYDYFKQTGVDGLATNYTNYTPFYTYLLLAAAQFDGWAEPIVLIKLISVPFEFGCAVVVYRLVQLATEGPIRPALAFVAVWLAPGVLGNGAVWGQADSIWTFFILLAIYLICLKRPYWALLPFAVAVSIKLQAVFLGPLILALVLKRKIHWASLAIIPLVYVVLALPGLIMGRPLAEVLTIYLNQAGYYTSLSMNAANLWLFVPNEFYRAGVVIGLALGLVAGLALSLTMWRKSTWSVQYILLASTVALQLMPWILPKMHDRYFYAFELTVIALAAVAPPYLVVAIAAQLTALVVYMQAGLPADHILRLGLLAGALINTTSVLFMAEALWTGSFRARSAAIWMLTITCGCAGLTAFLLI